MFFLNFVIFWHKTKCMKIGVWKKVFYKKWSPKLIFLNDLKKKILLFFDIEKWFWKYNFGTFWGPGIMSTHKRQQFHLTTVHFWPKTLLFRTQQVRNSMTQLTLVSTLEVELNWNYQIGQIVATQVLCHSFTHLVSFLTFPACF